MLLSLGQSTCRNSALTDEELSFLRAVEFSDVSSVRKLLGDNPSLNVDVSDVLGRSGLRLAVRNENRELVEMLLEVCNHENIQQAALQAISENHTTIAELILRHPRYLKIFQRRRYLGDTDGFFKMEVESQFSTDITPLNLAAQKNNFTIVQLLLERGESIAKPDKFDCGCQECRNRGKFDQLRQANFRLNAYRGLASEAYIALSSEDPFLTAFDLAKELRKLADKEKHFKKEYEDLANQLSSFAVQLLDRVWTQQELEMVLNKTGSAADSDRYENLARLRLALKNHEKTFVAHPSVQQHLVKLWHRDLQHYDTLPSWGRLAFLALLALVYPVLILAHLINPTWKWTKLAAQPMAKFVGHTTSYFLFLTLIIVSSWEQRVSSAVSLRTQLPAVFQEYTKYRSALGSEAVPTVAISTEGLSGRNVTDMLQTETVTNQHLYWLNADRQNWHQSDPNNLAEGLFAMANIVSFARIFHLLPANEMLGPMQISLRRTISDIIKILVFGSMAIFGFIVSLRNLFWWYSGTVAISSNPADREATNAATSFLDIRQQFITVFWWIYGRGPMNQALDVPDKYQNGDITEAVGNILAALYHIAIIIVLVNLFIAMMARSFEKIVDDVDSEWKFARSLLYMDYIDESCQPPVPINLLLPLRDVIQAAIYCLRHLRARGNAEPPLSALINNQRRKACYSDVFYEERQSPGSGRHERLTASSSGDEQLSYQDIVQTIVQRYIFDIQREEEINIGKLEEARQNICQLKWELLDLMEEREDRVGHLNACVRAISSELSTLMPTASRNRDGERRGDNSDVQKEKADDGDTENTEGDDTARKEYPKTNVIMSASRRL
ncbi:short transient receptor potential channel 7-like [Babylonia areolata]|uniref:short transient receptor potential channel 7-like n=1 Tax=Babylonia areolata TaxID=304850 RepID=UPI003FD1E316